MDWSTNIQRAIDYVEAHIIEQIDYGEVAKQAYSSSFYFQRVFHILCGFTLGDYIRMRRLTLAGNELITSKHRVIDLALKYGYDSPESFSRAFTKFHQVSPSQVKQGSVVLKSFSPLFVKLVLAGGNMLAYRIETKEAFPLICKKMKASDTDETTFDQISRFWRECIEDNTIHALHKYIPQNHLFHDFVVGASFGKDASDSEFPYAIGVVYNGVEISEKELVVEKIPAHTYLVFTCTGKMPEALMKLYEQILSEFFPASEFKPCDGVDFEAYPSADVSNPKYTCEIWLAVEKKKE